MSFNYINFWCHQRTTTLGRHYKAPKMIRKVAKITTLTRLKLYDIQLILHNLCKTQCIIIFFTNFVFLKIILCFLLIKYVAEMQVPFMDIHTYEI